MSQLGVNLSLPAFEALPRTKGAVDSFLLNGDSSHAGNDERPLSPSSKTIVNTESAADAVLQLLTHFGLKYLFMTTGTDFAPVQEALAKMAVQNDNRLLPIVVPHESVSSAMALGYSMITGQPAAVAVHVNVGSSNALGNVMNAAIGRLPLIVLAGRTPATQTGNLGSRDISIHWGQDVLDQSGIMRDFVKWDYEIKRIESLPEIIARAFKVTRSEPCGPVYLTFAREILMEDMTNVTLPDPIMAQPVMPIEASSTQAKEVVDILMRAENPLIIAGSVGRKAQPVRDLQVICNALAVRVSESVRTFMNYPTNDPMHVGFNTPELVKDADAILILDCMIPWIPAKTELRNDAKVIQVDQDPIFPNIALWSFPIDVQIRADSAVFISELKDEVDHLKLDTNQKKNLNERREKIAGQHFAWKKKRVEVAETRSKLNPIDMKWLCHEINGIFNNNDAILVNEVPSGFVEEQIDTNRPQSYFGSTGAGYLGRGLGVALALRLAMPDSLVVACEGDGSYIFSNPEAAHWVSNAYGLPFLTVIFNNQGWEAEKESVDKLYPQGWSNRYSKYVGVHLDPPGQYSKIVTAFGGYGEEVRNPDEITPALQRGIECVRNQNKQAVIDVICKKV
ncbi:MAG: thiamine pyrophosphate-requiring protein [Nitrososphaerota archaeon]|nr:thiamine pyrophosphate-requiring protein [Nitrososphaerota archaeon]